MNVDQAFAPLNDGARVLSNVARIDEEQFQPIVPAPQLPNLDELRHPKFGLPTAEFRYHSAAGDFLGSVCRWDLTKGGERSKEMRPLRYGVLNDRTGYYWKGWKGDAKRPLYGLCHLSHLGTAASVLLVEGEKAADHAAKLFPEFAVVSPMNGSLAPHLTDMTPLAGLEVTIWPDNDAAGGDFARTVAKLALAAEAKAVQIVKVPAEFPDKWDLADEMPTGCDFETLETLLLTAPFFRDAEVDGPDMNIAMRVRRPPPIFPTNVFGDLSSDMETFAASTSSPIDYTAMATLAICAAVIGNARSVSPWESWVESSCLWVAIVGSPSSGKSPALSPLINAVRILETDDAAEFAEDQRRWEKDAQAAKQRREAWEKEVKGAIKAGTEVPEFPVEAKEPAPPCRPRIVVSDTTPEALANLLAGQPRGLLSYRDELSGWLGSFDRYSTAQAERAFWLEAHGGRSYTVDRVKHGGAPIIIPRLLVSVLGGIQPEKLTTLLLSGDDDGLSARMLMVWPDPVPPHRPTVFANPEQILTCFRRLRSLKMVVDDGGALHPVVLKLTAEAADWFSAWWNHHYHATTEVAGMLAGHFGKYQGVLLRLALVLEHLWWSASPDIASPTSVSLTAVTMAGRFLDHYLRPMAECIYGDAAMPEIERLETVLARWILKTKPKVINARDLRRVQRLPGLRDAEKVKETLSALVEAGWLKKIPTRQGGTPGRQRDDYEVDRRVYLAVN